MPTTIPLIPAGPSAAQKLFFITIVRPIWNGQLADLQRAMQTYRHHLLALACLRQAVGPGGDPLQVADFCKKWTLPLTMPVFGPVALLRKLGKAAGGWPSPLAVFDPTGAINLGIKVVAQLGPLIGRVQLRDAQLIALDERTVARSDQSPVLAILDAAKKPADVVEAARRAHEDLTAVWNDTVRLAEKLDAAREESGLPEDLL